MPQIRYFGLSFRGKSFARKTFAEKTLATLIQGKFYQLSVISYQLSKHDYHINYVG